MDVFAGGLWSPAALSNAVKISAIWVACLLLLPIGLADLLIGRVE
jgi:hypothetical protein